jgi:hypothetical protein
MRVVVAWGLVVMAACSFPRPEPLAADQSCRDDSDCTSVGFGVCNTSAADPACVACLPARAEACTGTAPVCSDTSCRACSVHGDCASDACLPDGSCAAENTVVYLKQNGSGPNCTRMNACGLLATALTQSSATRKYIRVTGQIESAHADLDNKSRIFLGEAGAALRGDQGGGSPGDDPILRVRGGSQVEMYDLSLLDAKRYAVSLEAPTSTLKLQRSRVVSSGFEGVSVAGGTMTLLESEVSTCGDATHFGVSLESGELVIDRSRISENKGGGLTVALNRKFTITNSFIVGNLGNGGIAAQTPGVGSKLEFNTIADNRDDGSGVADSGGIFCDSVAFTFPYNIIFRNSGGAGGFKQTVGACKFDGSLVSSNTQAETKADPILS